MSSIHLFFALKLTSEESANAPWWEGILAQWTWTINVDAETLSERFE